MEKHYFRPSEENDRFCYHCDKYLTDEIHISMTWKEYQKEIDNLNL